MVRSPGFPVLNELESEGLTTVDEIDRLRRLAFNQTVGDAQAPDGAAGDWLEPSLDAKTVARGSPGRSSR